MPSKLGVPQPYTSAEVGLRVVDEVAESFEVQRPADVWCLDRVTGDAADHGPFDEAEQVERGEDVGHPRLELVEDQ